MSLTDEEVKLEVVKTALNFGYVVEKVNIKYQPSRKYSSEIEHDEPETDTIKEFTLSLDPEIINLKQLNRELVYFFGQIRFEQRAPLLARTLLPLFGERIAYREARKLGINASYKG